uniref:NHR domain-containing protein n=1 Tax=Panagrellus redivivus TaxID=6233 RepID=A0A7E4VGE3_PANRE
MMLSPKRFFESRPKATDQSIHLRPRDDTRRIRKGLVIEVTPTYGRLLCARSFSDTGVYVFFDHNTAVNGTPLHLGDFDLQSAVPVGAEVDFKLTYGFPSKWRSFGTSMAYFCEWISFDATKEVSVLQAELMVTANRPNGLVMTVDGEEQKAVLHPHSWPTGSTIKKLRNGSELETRVNHRFHVMTQPSRTLLSLVRPVPNFLKNKLRRISYICLSAQPLSTTVVCYAHLVGVGGTELLFDSFGTRDDTGDTLPVEIVMDKDIFLSSIGIDKSPKVNLYDVIGRPFQLGCVLNLTSQKHPLRAFCAYICSMPYIPKNPKMNMPRTYTRGVRQAAIRNPVVNAVEKKATPPSPPKNQFVRTHSRRSFYRKFAQRRSMRIAVQSRKRGPCSPYPEQQNAKRKIVDISVTEETFLSEDY